MRESELLAHIYRRSGDLAAPIAVGPGDDAAVLRIGGAEVLLTVDQLIEGRHYDPRTTPIELIARKAVARSVSDIAAMGGRPTCGLATGALRAGFAHADELFDAMARWARHWGCPLAGGDIAVVDGPTVLTVTVVGGAHPVRGAVLRSVARVGDGVYVTGRLGGSFESGRHLEFAPRVSEAMWLCDALGARLGAMMDVSDGLGRDAGRMAEASGVRIEIEGEALPRHEGVADWREAAAAGEDYELLFTARGDVATACGETGTPVTRIGRVVQGNGCVIRAPGGEVVDATELGWDHGV